jgi:hypothetical protein
VIVKSHRERNRYKKIKIQNLNKEKIQNLNKEIIKTSKIESKILFNIYLQNIIKRN